MSHRISILKNFISNEDCKKFISLIKEYEDKNLLLSFKDNPEVLIVPEKNELLEIIKKYSDLIIQKHKEINS